ncbi:MAG: hypothetical protein WBI06_12300 [Paludibacter sp.]
MSKLIKKFRDGSILEYDKGSFDEWCIYLTRPDVSKYPPKDLQYFQRLKTYADKHGAEQVYHDFVEIYDATKKETEQSVFEKITELSLKYVEDSISIDIDLSIIYAGMVSEEKKRNTRLGKRIKRLGVHQVLFNELSPEEAAYFSRGKAWTAIATHCKERGF